MKGRKYSKGGMCRAKGGRVPELVSGNPNVVKESKSSSDLGKISGGKSRMRLDRPGRKRGGRVGSDMAPLSSAHNDSSPSKEAD
jgi:hypothetical protein